MIRKYQISKIIKEKNKTNKKKRKKLSIEQMEAKHEINDGEENNKTSYVMASARNSSGTVKV